MSAYILDSATEAAFEIYSNVEKYPYTVVATIRITSPEESRESRVSLHYQNSASAYGRIETNLSLESLKAIKGFQDLGILDESKSKQSHLIEQIFQKIPLSERSSTHFCLLPILAECETGMIGAGLVPLWKWSKPESPYLKNSMWTDKLDDVLEDGEWKGGKNLTIIVRGVSKEVQQEIASHMVYGF